MPCLTSSMPANLAVTDVDSVLQVVNVPITDGYTCGRSGPCCCIAQGDFFCRMFYSPVKKKHTQNIKDHFIGLHHR